MNKICVCLFIFLTVGINGFSQNKKNAPKPIPPITFKDGILSYTSDNLGNRIPDFSFCGYKASEEPIPTVDAKVFVAWQDGDMTEILQSAIDYVGTLPLDKNGFRGAILLDKGSFKIEGQLKIRQSGIVIRGSGVGENGTNLIAAGKDRRTLIRILGQNDKQLSSSIKIVDSYVPVNSFTVTLSDKHGLKAGDNILIQRPSTKEWIDELGTDHFGGGITSLGWKPSEQDIYWDRTITSVNGNKITFDAPLTTALDQKYGGGFIVPYTWNGRISNIGIENLSCISEYDINNPKDEAHAWMAITMENISDAWVRSVVFKHFAGSAVAVLESAKRVTVENCKSLAPVSEIGGQRRYTFFTSGQQCLFQRLYAEQGYHDFALGFCAAGPNAFVQCHSELPYSFSGPVDSWASGVLFDVVNINGNALSYKNRMQEAQGAGWNAANSVFWQCTASLMECFAPPIAQNWAFGSWSEFSGDGYWNESNNHINPRSLYYTQLKERLRDKYIDRANLLAVETEASSSPPIHVAQELTKKAYEAPLTLSEWIDILISKNNIPVEKSGIKSFEQKSKVFIGKRMAAKPLLTVKNGWLVRNNTIQTGGKHNIQWWNGTVQPSYLKKSASPHLTRFVPGRTGTGLTDDIDSVGSWMKKEDILVLDHNYGLWYDRRRDDHERIRRINGEVWPPFYEQPFARSGEGTAYDGLSKYDLTKYNDWYWRRLRQFADVADQKELILFHQNYFQHNIIEAGAHWADSPWRPANNINNTGFPEPAPYAGDKRIFLAEQFYDINHPVRRELHRAFIRTCLENFRGNNSVVQLISEEYTGPLHFVEFWLDVIAEWENETGERPLIALSATKDVQDAILTDPVRSKVVDIIDIRYWFYREDGTTYEPQGGLNLAPRQHARLTKPGKVSFESVYRAVNEYRTKYADKAVTYFSNSYPERVWASFMAGGSLTNLPRIANEHFLEDASFMQSIPEMNSANQYVLGDKNKGLIIYTSNKSIDLDLSKVTGKFTLYRINPVDGSIIKEKSEIKGETPLKLMNPTAKDVVIWLKKK